MSRRQVDTWGTCQIRALAGLVLVLIVGGMMKLGRIERVVALVVGAFCVHGLSTACSGAEGKARGGDVHTAACSGPGGYAEVSLPGMTAEEIASSVTAFGRYAALGKDGWIGEVVPVQAKDGGARVSCGLSQYGSVEFFVP